MTTGEQVRRERQRRGLSIAELARLTGVSARTISRIESGATSDPRTLVKVEDYLGLGEESARAEPANPNADAELTGASDGALWAQLQAVSAELQRRFYAALDSDGARSYPGMPGQLPPAKPRGDTQTGRGQSGG